MSHGQQHVLSQEPYNSEPRPATLVSNRLTTDLYHRNHGPILHLDPQTFKLDLTADALPELPQTSLSLDDVRTKFTPTQVEGMLLCAGNRRNEMDHTKEVEGLKWDRSAIANARWEGARLNQVLEEWGVKADSGAGLHCHFESDQKDPEVPVLLAYKMNGQNLPVEHGGPLRVYIPGVIGARSVKWVQRILIRDHESTCFYQKKDYKILPPQATAETKQKYMQETPAMLEYGMNAAICSPEPDQSINHVSDGKIEVSGYAYGAKGTPLKAVYVTVLPSTSSSESLKDSHERAASLPDSAWARAELETGDPVEGSSKNFAWTLWKAHVPVPTDHHGKIALVAWCEDINGQKQPVQVDWNIRGIGEAGWSVVTVSLV